MAKSKKPRKRSLKRTLSQHERHIAIQALKNIVVVYVHSVDEPMSRMFDLQKNRFVEVDQLKNESAHNYAQKWIVTCSILMREKNGKIKAPSEQCAAYDESGAVTHVLFSTLVPTLDTYHRRMVRECSNPECLVNVAWIANPSGRELTPERELEIYELAGGFSAYVAPWELKQRERPSQPVCAT